MLTKWSLIFLFILTIMAACKERFEPNLPSADRSYLIAEGFINTGAGPTTITLSRSTPIDQAKTFKPELNAIVHVEGDDNSLQPLSSVGAGLYSINQLSLNSSRKYRVRIKTKDGKEYLSSFVSVKTTPPIDSVSWKEENGGVTIYANTHDPQNNTRYYKWDYDETWEIRSNFGASMRYINGVVRAAIASDPEIFICYKQAKSTNILLGSTAKLEEDIVHLNPLLFIPYRDEKIAVRYSILLKQYAIDKGEFQFMSQMKKNTESLGTIFDPQPSAISGNIQCVTDPSELVIGYIGATSEVQERMFISSGQISGPRFRMNCQTDTIDTKDIYIHVPSILPYEGIYSPLGALIGYKTSSPECVDCRTRGSNIKPSFW